MTQKSKSRKASCVPFRGRGPRSGEGVDGGKNDYGILILCLIAPLMCSLCIASIRGAADWRSVPRWSILSVLCPVHPLPLRGTSPQGETRDMREKQRVIYFMYHFGVFPLWWLAPPPCPRKRGHYECLAMWPCLCRKAWKPILPPEQGWQGNTIRKGAKRPENRVTRFPVEKSGAAG